MCVNEKKRGDLVYLGGVVGEETDGGAQSLVEVDVQERPRVNGGYRQMRLGVVNVLVCTGRQGVVWLGRNRHRTSSETEELGEEIGEVWGVRARGVRGEI